MSTVTFIQKHRTPTELRTAYEKLLLRLAGHGKPVSALELERFLEQAMSHIPKK